MRKQVVSIVLAAMMGISLLSGCGSTSGSNSTATSSAASSSTAAAGSSTEAAKAEPVKIKFMQNSASGGREDILKSMIEDFQKKNAGVTVDYEIVAYKDYYTKLNTLLSAGEEAPDVYEVGYENFASYAAKGLLMDITDTVAKDTSFKTDSMKKLAYDAYKYNGKQMGMCTDYTGVIMYYNKDLFGAKGVAYPTADWTWKEELAAAQKLTDTKNGVWGTVAPLQVYEFYKTIAQNGGSVWGADGKTVTVNSKECVDALQWMIDKSNKYKVQPPFTSDIYTQADADWRAFEAGKIAMFRTGTWQLGEFAKNAKCKWDIVVEPGNTQKGHHFFSNGLVVNKDSKYADADWAFLKYMAIDNFVVNTRIEQGWNIPVLNSDEVMDAYYRQTPPESKKFITGILDSLVLPPLGSIPDQWGDIQKAIGDELDKAKLGKETPQKALDETKIKLEKLVK